MSLNSSPIRLRLDFEWLYAAEGYHWYTSEDESGLPRQAWMRPTIPLIGPRVHDGVIERYRPFDRPALFKIFANTPCTSDGVLGFAQRYGLLLSTGGRFGESQQEWYAAIRQLQLAVALWDAANGPSDAVVARLAKDLTAISDYWTKDTPIVIRLPSSSPSADAAAATAVAAADLPVEVRLVSWKEQTVGTLRDLRTKRDAEDAVARMINAVLHDAPSSRTYLALNRALPKNRYVLEIGPDTLLGALWLQFTEAVAANAEYRLCRRPRCGSYIDMRTDRTNKHYCSDSCRTLDFYNRHPDKHPSVKRAREQKRRTTTKR